MHCRIISWQLNQGVQSTPENSLQYANDNALLIAKVFKSSVVCKNFIFFFSLHDVKVQFRFFFFFLLIRFNFVHPPDMLVNKPSLFLGKATGRSH